MPFGQALQKLRDHHALPNLCQVLECDRPCSAFHIGHFGPFTTHDLVPFTNQAPAAAARASAKPKRSPRVQSTNYTGQNTVAASVAQVKSLKRQIERHQETTVHEMPDRSYQFSAAKLVPRGNHIPHLPVMNVSVDTTIIPNHGDIDTQAFLTFLREFIGAFTAEEIVPRR